jgi:predicted dinucleotide-binding enzyme
MKMTVAVIGAADSVGSAIAYGLAAAGYRVLLTDDFENHLASFVSKLPVLLVKTRLKVPGADVRIVFSAREASWEADIVVVAVPCEAQAELARKIRDVVTRKIVISVVNPLNKRHDGLGTAPTGSAAEELAELLPYSKIVRAFKTNSPADFKRPKKAGTIADVSVAGDDQEAVSTTMQLVKDMGFNPLFVGQLAMSRRLENTICEADHPHKQVSLWRKP